MRQQPTPPTKDGSKLAMSLLNLVGFRVNVARGIGFSGLQGSAAAVAASDGGGGLDFGMLLLLLPVLLEDEGGGGYRVVALEEKVTPGGGGRTGALGLDGWRGGGGGTAGDGRGLAGS